MKKHLYVYCAQRNLSRISQILLIIYFFILSSCTLNVSLSGLKGIKITDHETVELSTERVFIDFVGECPKDTVSLTSIVDGVSKSALNQNSFKEITSKSDSELLLHCDEDNKALIRYLLPDPNYDGPLSFTFLAVNRGGGSVPTVYNLNYKRPLVPAPVITDPPLSEIYINQPSLMIKGTCISERITGLEYSFNNGSWVSLDCEDNAWATSFSSLLENTNTGYEFKIRAKNVRANDQYSTIKSVVVFVDLTSPASSPSIMGVSSTSDKLVDEWFGGVYPTISWQKDINNPAHNDIKNVSIKIRDSNLVDYCGVDAVKNTGSYTFKEDNCSNISWSNTETYTATLSGYDVAGNEAVADSSFSFKFDDRSPQLAFLISVPLSSKANYLGLTWEKDYLGGSPLEIEECVLDGQVISCGQLRNSGTESILLQSLSTGNHTFKITIFDHAGNSSTIFKTWTIEADDVQPICQFTSLGFEWSNESAIPTVFNCADGDGVRKVDCRLNSSAWTSCDSFSGHLFNVTADGENTFYLRAVDHSGLNSEIVSQSFKRDTVLPTLSWEDILPAKTNQINYSIGHTSFDADSGILKTECAIDNDNYSDCPNPATIGSLGDGNHIFKVRLTDRASNEAVFSQSWQIDTIPPLAPIMAADGEALRKPTFSWASGGGDGAGIYRYSLNDSNFLSPSDSVLSSYTPLFDLPFGINKLYVQERDDVGNWSPAGVQTLDVKCDSGEFRDGPSSCQSCSIGTYQPNKNLSPTCLAAPKNTYAPNLGSTSTVLCPIHSQTLGTGSGSIADCLGDEGYFDCQGAGGCKPVGPQYYSSEASNDRFACPTNSESAGVGAGAKDLASCLAIVDYYYDGSGFAPVGAGFYSPYRENTRMACTNKPSHATSVSYTSSGNGTNNCPVGSVISCDFGYTPSGASCLKSSPDAFAFTNLTAQERNVLVVSNAVVVTNYEMPLTAYCTNCEVSKNGTVWGASISGVLSGDTLTLRTMSSGSFNTTVSASVALGTTTSATWTVTTRNALSCNGGALGTIPHGGSVTAYSSSQSTQPLTCAQMKETRTCGDGTLSGSYGFATCSDGCTTPWGTTIANGQSVSAYHATTTSVGEACVNVHKEIRTCTNGVLSGSAINEKCYEWDFNKFVGGPCEAQPDLGTVCNASKVGQTLNVAYCGYSAANSPWVCRQAP